MKKIQFLDIFFSEVSLISEQKNQSENKNTQPGPVFGILVLSLPLTPFIKITGEEPRPTAGNGNRPGRGAQHSVFTHNSVVYPDFLFAKVLLK